MEPVEEGFVVEALVGHGDLRALRRRPVAQYLDQRLLVRAPSCPKLSESMRGLLFSMSGGSSVLDQGINSNLPILKGNKTREPIQHCTIQWLQLEIPCTAFLMFSASSVAEGIEMEAMEAGATPASPGRAGSEKCMKRRLRGGMLWIHSRQQRQQHMAHA